MSVICNCTTSQKCPSHSTVIIKHSIVISYCDKLYPTIWRIVSPNPEYEMRRISKDEVEIRRIGQTTTLSQDSRKGGEHSVKLNKKGVYVELLVEQIFLPKNQWRFYAEIEELKLEHAHLADKFEDAYTLSPYCRENLFIIKAPELVYEWSTQNQISIGLVLAGDDCKYSWNCMNDKGNHPVFPQSMKKRVAGGQGCSLCFIERQRQGKMSTMDKCKESELAILKLFLEAGVKTTHTGSDSAHVFDLIVQFLDKVLRGVQVKCISDPRGTGKYCGLHRTRWNQEYPPDTLIVGINVKHSLYYLAFSRDLATFPTTLRFSTLPDTKSKYSAFVYRDLEVFTRKMIEMTRSSTDISTLAVVRSVNYQKEYEMKSALCKLISFREADDVYGDVDGYLGVGMVASQLKFTNQEKGVDCFVVCNLRKHNGVTGSVPYGENATFQVLVIQTSASDTDFLILPKSVLLKDGFLTNDFYEGKKGIIIPSPSNLAHRYSKYWNRFDLLNNPNYQPDNDIYDNIAQQCIDLGHNVRVDRSNLQRLVLIVNDLRVKIHRTTDGRFRIYTEDMKRCCIEDVPPFFLIVSQDNDFWVIPSRVLIECKFIGATEKESKTSVTISGAISVMLAPYKNTVEWFFK